MTKPYVLSENPLGEDLLQRLSIAITRTALIKAGCIRELTCEPVCWGTQEYRLRVLHAGDVSARSVRVIDYAGCDFFGATYWNHSAEQGQVRRYAISNRENALIDMRHYLITGTVPRQLRLDEILYNEWLNGVDVTYAMLNQHRLNATSA